MISGNILRFGYRLATGTAVVFASIALTLIALEVCLRLFDGVPFSAINFVDRAVNTATDPQKNPAQRYDERLGWTEAANFIVIDNGKQQGTLGEYGARMSSREIVPLQEGAILVVGDSFGLGSDVMDAETWPAQLEKMTGTQVINAAVGGYGLDQTVLRAEDLLPLLRPKVLLVQTNLHFGISLNRMNIFAGAPKPYFVSLDGRLTLKNQPVPRGVSRSIDIGWTRSIFGYAYLAQFVMMRLDLLQWWISPANMSSNFIQSQQEALEVSCLLMRRLGEFRDRYKTFVALVFQYGGPDGAESALSWEKDRAYVSRCAEQQHLPVVDIHRALRAYYEEEGVAAYKELWNMSDAGRAYGHMTAKGNKLVADLVFRSLFSPDVSEARPLAPRP